MSPSGGTATVTPNDELTRSLDLMKRAQGGDDAALNRLVERYYDRVRPIVRARLGERLRRRVDSGDILQNTFATVVRTYDRFDVNDEASLIAWMSRIAENQILDEHDRQSAKKRRAEREVELDAGASDDRAVDPSSPANGPGESVERRERDELLEEALGELSELYRELILLRDYMGFSWEEVASRTGRPTAAAARMMHATARIELGKLLRQRGV
ncbi:MAG: RNA polymerase sigma factor [Planctomycetota bacterium JB042]